MGKPEFDSWCTVHLIKTAYSFSKSYSKARGHEEADMSDFYLHIVAKLPTIDSPSKYYRTFVYNRHYKYYNGHAYTSAQGNVTKGLIMDKKHCQIKLASHWLYDLDIAEDVYDSELDDLLETVTKCVSRLPIDDKNLFNYYYVQGLSQRKIAALLKVSHVLVFKQLEKMRKTLKVLIMIELIDDGLTLC